MNTNKSRIFTRFIAAAIAAAGILGGAALGMAAGANADPGPSDHSSGGYSSEYRPSDSRDSYWSSGPRDFWNFWFSHHHRDHSFRWHHS